MGADRAFVTGGSGVVGRPIVSALLAQGRTVVALARSETARRTLEGLGARPAAGDVLDGERLVGSMRGCDVVFHVAGLNAFCLSDPTPLYRANVAGSRAVVRAAARAGARRLVYTSSAAVLGEAPGTVGREDSQHRGWFLSHYERSKWEAERIVVAEALDAGIELVCVNPSSVQGPGRAGGTARILRLYLEGRLRFLVDTRVSLVDVGDCAAGHLLAEERGRSGERYVLNGATMGARDAVTILAEASGVEVTPWLLPRAAARAAGACMEVAAKVTARTPPLCREMVRSILHGHTYDGSKATRELGLHYRPVEDTLRRTFEWLVGAGYVARPRAGPGA
jgi:dihydroflavonol-4-reductase